MSNMHGHRLKQARKSVRLTQEQVMLRTGVNSKTLSGYEVGTSQPDFDSLMKLCALYEISTDWIITGHNYVSNENSNSIELDSESFLEMKLSYKGKLLNETEKRKILEITRIMLGDN